MAWINTNADVAEGLAWLARRDRRLHAVIDVAGPLPLRRTEGGLPGLARIVVGQQVSVASAAAIWQRTQASFPGLVAADILAADESRFRAAGLSMPKIRTLRAIATACNEGLDLDRLATIPAEEAHGRLTAIKGIGPWTADIYLLFCLGHADVFPAGDLALRKAVGDAFGGNETPSIEGVAEIASDWSPWRGVAARLFWAYYRATRQKAAVPV